MNISPIKSLLARHNSQPRRSILPGLLLVALALAVIASGALAAGGNLVKNGSFEKDGNGDGIPNSWVGANLTPADKRVCNQSYAGSCSFKFVFDGNSKSIEQNISISGNSGDAYNLVFWMKGKAITGPGVVRIDLGFSSGLAGYTYTLDGNSPWTKYSLPVQAPANYTSIYILIRGSEDSGKAWFDKVKLVGP